MGEKKEKKVNLVIEEIKNDLGTDFGKAVQWYKLMHPSLEYMKTENYREMKRQWQLCTFASSCMVEEEICTVEQDLLDKTYRSFLNMFGGDPLKKRSDDEKRVYIASCLDTFTRQTTTEELHKKNVELLKISLDDIEFDHLGNGFFDSSNASSFVNGNIIRRDKKMRWIATSEDGISRILAEHGLSQVVAWLGDQSQVEEEMKDLLHAKEQIFLKGITDKATGKHYLCSAPSASSTRSADFPFIEADYPEQVYEIWCQVTGFATIEDLVHGIGKFKNGKWVVNLAKLKARIAMRGSNSFDAYSITKNPNVLFKLMHPNVDYVRDAVGHTSKPYKTITAPGVLEMKNPDGTVTVQRV